MLPSRIARRAFQPLGRPIVTLRPPIQNLKYVYSTKTTLLPSASRTTPKTSTQWRNRSPIVHLHIRLASTTPTPRPKPRILRWIYRSFALCGFSVLLIGGLVVAFFAYDATTYKECLSNEDIPVPELALNPRRGGPKNLPIAEHLVDDEDCPEKRNQRNKPKLVVLGTGWGSVALLKQLNPEDYHVTVVSPSNYFLFTPMLPSATVGTLELRSLVEPVRRIIARVQGHFIKGTAEDVDFSQKLVEVSAPGPRGERQHFYLPYDKLVIGVGKQRLNYVTVRTFTY